jgi:hypothetical protein
MISLILDGFLVDDFWPHVTLSEWKQVEASQTLAAVFKRTTVLPDA